MVASYRVSTENSSKLDDVLAKRGGRLETSASADQVGMKKTILVVVMLQSQGFLLTFRSRVVTDLN